MRNSSYEVFIKLYDFFKTYGIEKMDSYHKNTKLSTRRFRMEYECMNLTNPMIDNFNQEAGSIYDEYDYLNEQDRKEINKGLWVCEFSSFYDHVY